jgi:hypothetical protein
MNKPNMKQVASSFTLLERLFFDPEDGGSICLRNVMKLLDQNPVYA